MSQHSFSISNEAGAAFRADVNNALQALASCSRGATSPATTYAGQVWDDSTANVQRKRNAANSTWIVKATLDETFVLSRSSNTILGLSDIGKSIVATSTFTQTLTAVATLGDGWYVDYRNDGTGIITLDPNAAETIDGAATLTLYAGEGCRIWCNGSAFKTVGRTTGLVLIQRQVASASAQIDFTIGLDSTFDEYMVFITDLSPATDNVALVMRVSEDGGGTFKSGATDYTWDLHQTGNGGVTTVGGSTGDTGFRIAGSASNTSSAALWAEIRVSAPSGTSRRKMFCSRTNYQDASGTHLVAHGGGTFKLDTNAINALRFLMSSGNITVGTFALYGVRKS